MPVAMPRSREHALHVGAVLDLDDVEMVDVSFVGAGAAAARCRSRESFASYAARVAAPRIVPAIQMAKLYVEDRGLNRIEAAVSGLHEMLVLLALSEIAQQPSRSASSASFVTIAPASP